MESTSYEGRVMQGQGPTSRAESLGERERGGEKSTLMNMRFELIRAFKPNQHS